MSVSTARRKPITPGSDSTDQLFYWAVGTVVVVGLAANFYRSYREEAPSMTTFLDLLTANKTHFCGARGELLNPIPAVTAANCLDYNGYRIVQGPTTVIYSIRTEQPETADGVILTKVADLNTEAMKRLFNLNNLDITYSIPEYPWP